MASADQEFFEFTRHVGGDAVASIEFPPYYPELRFQLRGKNMLIGRYSAKRGTDPDIDLTGPPEDPAISRSHALLIARSDGAWDLVDLPTLGPTYLNDYNTEPLAPNVRFPLGHGDRIYLGAWTKLTIRVGGGA